jgi:hypothetical protein
VRRFCVNLGLPLLMRLPQPPFKVMNGYLMRKISQPNVTVHRNGEPSVHEKRLAAAGAKC